MESGSLVILAVPPKDKPRGTGVCTQAVPCSQAIDEVVRVVLVNLGHNGDLTFTGSRAKPCYGYCLTAPECRADRAYPCVKTLEKDGKKTSKPTVTKKAIRDAESRIIAGEHASLKDDLLKILLALFEKQDVSDRLFPALAKVFENGVLEIRMLVLILLLMAIKRRKDITSTLPVLQEAFIENWERPKNLIPFNDWCKIDKLLKRPTSEYNQLSRVAYFPPLRSRKFHPLFS